ncbi:hypothetical protein YC2023_101301 [Brassica napus]
MGKAISTYKGFRRGVFKWARCLLPHVRDKKVRLEGRCKSTPEALGITDMILLSVSLSKPIWSSVVLEGKLGFSSSLKTDLKERCVTIVSHTYDDTIMSHTYGDMNIPGNHQSLGLLCPTKLNDRNKDFGDAKQVGTLIWSIVK